MTALISVLVVFSALLASVLIPTGGSVPGVCREKTRKLFRFGSGRYKRRETAGHYRRKIVLRRRVPRKFSFVDETGFASFDRVLDEFRLCFSAVDTHYTITFCARHRTGQIGVCFFSFVIAFVNRSCFRRTVVVSSDFSDPACIALPRRRVTTGRPVRLIDSTMAGRVS